ncbi:MAG: GntR family transcriptional regulator [Alphaproteobacteria bacterium]|nr:MAG: GntR family transcriptional regulator [Alphaproteobacteria bacterium]
MEGAPGFRPLYRQVYDHLVKQIASGAWKPSEALPSEQALAAKLGVSQGTVRKALDAMAGENIIERRQGKGTYVAEYNEERALFRFFRMARPGGERALPECGQEDVDLRKANREEADKLGLDRGTSVYEIRRTRLIDGKRAIYEHIVVPAARFPRLKEKAPLPNALYTIYQSPYGVNIVQTEEELRADLARKEDNARLGIPIGSPILHIERVAREIEGTPVEFRITRCDTTHLVYAVTIR